MCFGFNWEFEHVPHVKKTTRTNVNLSSLPPSPPPHHRRDAPPASATLFSSNNNSHSTLMLQVSLLTFPIDNVLVRAAAFLAGKQTCIATAKNVGYNSEHRPTLYVIIHSVINGSVINHFIMRTHAKTQRVQCWKCMQCLVGANNSSPENVVTCVV
jgi:hypothetical protein